MSAPLAVPHDVDQRSIIHEQPLDVLDAEVGDGAERDEGDGVAIVRSITTQCTGATFCWLVNSRTVQALCKIPGLRVVRRASFGAVELLVLHVLPWLLVPQLHKALRHHSILSV